MNFLRFNILKLPPVLAPQREDGLDHPLLVVQRRPDGLTPGELLELCGGLAGLHVEGILGVVFHDHHFFSTVSH